MAERRHVAAVLITALLLSLLGAAPAHAVSSPRPGDPFAGMGTWVSVFMDTWDNPRAHVRRMHEQGVTTLYLQTSSSRTPVNSKVFRPDRVGRFIDAAHARGMKVVAWYLPPLANVAPEYDRAMAAIRFRSSTGQRFDGFALDIEPSARTPGVEQRNENLLRLSRRIRRSVGPEYPLGAIIPSPIGMRLSPKFWPQFPYADLGRFYDTIVPMSYHTYRVSGPEATYEYTRRNIAILRRHYGREVRIHMIGGEADASNRRETRAFVRAVNDAGVLGASLWHYGTHAAHDWEALRRLRSTAARGATSAAAQMTDAEPEPGPEPSPEPPPEPLAVNLEASSAAFSPNGDGRKDTVTVTARTSRRATVRFEVRDHAGDVVRRWRVLGPARSHAVTWMGRGGGARLADGTYVVRAVAVAADTATDEARLRVRLDTRPPGLRLGRLALSDASAPLPVQYVVRAGAAGARLRLQLRDLAVVRSVTARRPSGPGSVQIRQRYADGQRLLPGEYQVVLTAVDAAGNRTTRTRRLVIARPAKAAIFRRVETKARKVALTFDDCHLTAGWARILDTLKRQSVTATFFCPGDRLALYPQLGRRTVAEGHVAAAHGWDHQVMTRLSYSAIKQRLEKDQAAWAKMGATAMPYFRPPYGAVNASVVAAAGAAGYPRVMMWDVDSRDFTGVSGARLVCNAICTARPGSVILLHTNDRTAAALPDIIAGLRRRGLEPVGLPELFRSGGHH
jgi:peptidoglycan/xylan/chitin deacetylase (PgdA/CDA1 family)